MSYKLPNLSYEPTGMAPFLSGETFEFHYGKHHKAYIDNMNKLLPGSGLEDKKLAEIVKAASGGLFNNAAQAWNHSFFWECLSPKGGGEPRGDLADAIGRDFGGFPALQKALSEAAVKLFGSGWAWLAADRRGKLAVMALSNADTPLKYEKEPLLTIDVWEHAYYIDYRNDRAKYVEGFWKAVHWDFAAKCFAAATKQA